jgi:hypothetical protein
MNCERAAVGRTDGYSNDDNPEAGVSMTKINLKKLYERRRREAAEPVWEAKAKAADALVNKLEQMVIAQDRDGLEGVQRLLHRWKVQRERRPKKEFPPPKMPPFNFGPRTSLTELRPRHLLMVEEYGHQLEYDRDALRDYFLDNWYRLFGPLRKSKALEVPSDQFRKELMVSRLLDLIEMRRKEYANERAGRSII